MTAQLSTLVSENYRNIDPTRLTSVVILSCNRKSMMEKSITSLRQRTDLPYEVVILDNGSQDKETLDYLKSIDGTSREGNGKVKVIYNPTNEGCSVGRNKAVQHAKGDYIVTMDNDMLYTNNWLEELIEKAESNKKIGAVSSQIVFPDHTVQWNGGYIERKQGNLADFTPVDYHKEEDSEELSGEMFCDWLPGGATLVKREVLDKGVEHDNDYINGYEDYDYSLKIKKEGFLLANCPKSKVIHYHRKYDPDFGKGKDQTYANNRNSHKTLFESLKVFFQRTGYNLMEELDGTKIYRKAFKGQTGHAMDKKLAVKFEADNRPINELGIRRMRRSESVKKRRGQIKRQYKIDSIDINDINQDIIKRILEPYTAKIKARKGDWNLEKISEEITRILARQRKAYSKSNSFFDRAGAVSQEGVEEILDSTLNYVRDPDAWWQRHILETALKTEIKYLGVEPEPAKGKKGKKKKDTSHRKNTLSEKIKNTYDLAEDTTVKVFHEEPGEHRNKLWLVKSDGKSYLLKRYYRDLQQNGKPARRVALEHKVLKHLDKKGFDRFANALGAKRKDVEGVRVNEDYPSIITIGKNNYALYDYLQGDHPNMDQESCNDTKRVASTLAHFHNAVKDLDTDKKTRNVTIQKYKGSRHVEAYKKRLAGTDKKHEKKVFERVDSFVSGLEQKLKGVAIPRMMCHNDLYSENVVMSGKNAHLIDLEGLTLDYRLQDFALAMYHFACDKDGLSHKRMEKFSQVYQARFKLTDQELEMVPDFLLLMVPHIMQRHARKAGEGQIRPSMIDYCDNYMDFVEQNRAEIIHRMRRARACAA